MSTTITKRKRTRQACIPCHQRKRKCDAKYPCSMCVDYDYSCRYADDYNTSTAGITVHQQPSVKRVRLEGADATSRSPSSRSDVPRMIPEAERSLKSPSAGVNAPAAIATAPGIFDEHKLRYAGSSAVMAFPHVLSVALGSEGASKMHSFAYNFGIRPEEASNAHGSLSELILETDLVHYSGIYFSAMGSIGDLIDPRIYAQRCQEYYQGSTTMAFGAIAAGIAALGSFLSPNRYSRESDLVQYAKAILDDPASMRMLDIDHIVAWGMRIFYLRATSRPNNAWIASCTAMHLCEAVGLHEDENIKKIASVAGGAARGHDADRLRRIFWITWAGHNILSYEYDRSSVHFRTVTCQSIMPISGSVADQFVQIAQIIPAPNSPFRLEHQPPTVREELFERLKSLDELQFIDPFLVVTKADVAFCFYRRIYQLKMGISDEIIRLIIDIGAAAVEAAEQLTYQGRLFWNVIGSVFHFACVLLAIDTPTASEHIPTVMKCLETLVNAADTRLTREALSMAQHLLSLSLAKKRKQLAQLELIEATRQLSNSQPEPEAAIALPDFDWEVDWDQLLLEPYISMLSHDIQLM